MVNKSLFTITLNYFYRYLVSESPSQAHIITAHIITGKFRQMIKFPKVTQQQIWTVDKKTYVSNLGLLEMA